MQPQSKPMLTKESGPKYPKLSAEQREAVLNDLKEHQSLSKLQREKPASAKLQ